MSHFWSVSVEVREFDNDGFGVGSPLLIEGVHDAPDPDEAVRFAGELIQRAQDMEESDEWKED